MKVLYDLNVLLDVFMDRDPWVVESKPAVQLAIDNTVTGYVIAISLTTLFYLTRRSVGTELARKSVGYCLSFLKVAPVDEHVLSAAWAMGGDFEDRVQLMSARLIGADAIVTRDSNGFEGSPIRVYSPDELLAEIQS